MKNQKGDTGKSLEKGKKCQKISRENKNKNFKKC
jgi:hypothetical protein